jgi:YHS domain-containing protein
MKRIGLGVGAVVVLLAVSGITFAAADAKEKQKSKPYPLSVCLVTDEKLGDMGEPHVIQYKGREIKFCCDHCEKDFRTEPQKFLAKLDKAAKSSATKPSTQESDTKPDGHKHGDDHKH